MASAEQVRALMQSHFDGDHGRFMSIAMQVAAGESRKGHTEFSAELRCMIEKAKEQLGTRQVAGETIPFAAARGELSELFAVYHPQTKLADMVLPKAMQTRMGRIVGEHRQMAMLRGHNLHPRQKLLLSGPPGCGKTMTAHALAGELGLPLFIVRLDALMTKFLGETAGKLRLIFDSMEKVRAVYLFDEFDSIGTERGSTSDVGEMRRVLNSFLMLMEAYHGTSLVIAATNHGHTLDQALFRRFDDLLAFSLPTKELLTETIRRRLAVCPVKATVTLTKVADAAVGLSFAEVVRACDEAIKSLLLEGQSDLKTADLLAALEERRAFLTPPAL
ncbi:ATP-dependent zinc metalloprotease FtsH [mine drainage metagenome]|uniref:ATP-dependent zinc metalloprotease FtsH n=1 Tax=mine drainage metagenome TaxID=410659 RepID=A0A1J5RBD9_9ZZZZ